MIRNQKIVNNLKFRMNSVGRLFLQSFAMWFRIIKPSELLVIHFELMRERESREVIIER